MQDKISVHRAVADFGDQVRQWPTSLVYREEVTVNNPRTRARPLRKSWFHGRECGRETFLPRGAKVGGRIRRRIAGGRFAGAEPAGASSPLQSMDLSSRALRLAEQRD